MKSGSSSLHCILHTIINTAHDSILVIDRKHRVLLMNNAAEKNLSQTSKQKKDLFCYMAHGLTTPCNEHGLTCPLAEVVASGKPFATIHQHNNKNGGTFPVEILASPIVDRDGEILGIVKLERDISERKKEEEKQADQYQYSLLNEKQTSVRRLIGGIAHHYNNMLMGIIGHTLLLQQKSNGHKDLSLHANCITDAAWRMTELTRMLTVYSGKERVHNERLNLNEEIEQTLMNNFTQKPADISFSFRLEESPWQIEGDASLLSRLIVALLTNAYEAMEGKSGKIHIETANEWREKGWNCLPHDHHPAGAYFRVSISDAGCGIASEDLTNIFDPFFTTKFPGRGMGLSFVHGVVNMHDGCITVESKKKKGTTINLFFPCSQTAKETPVSEDSI